MNNDLNVIRKTSYNIYNSMISVSRNMKLLWYPNYTQSVRCNNCTKHTTIIFILPNASQANRILLVVLYRSLGPEEFHPGSISVWRSGGFSKWHRTLFLTNIINGLFWSPKYKLFKFSYTVKALSPTVIEAYYC